MSQQASATTPEPPAQVYDAPGGDAYILEIPVADAKAGGQKAILLRVKSGDQTRYVALSFARA